MEPGRLMVSVMLILLLESLTIPTIADLYFTWAASCIYQTGYLALETAADTILFLFMESTSRFDNLSTSISESRTVIQLPHELITEILLRLPVKSLLKFKCVSKSWLSLISDPQFIRSHFSKSSSLELLFATETSMKKCSLYSALQEADPSTHVSAIEFPAPNTDSIVGIINGLVCLNLKGTELCVWNPALNKIKHLNGYPEAPSPCPHCLLEYLFSFGYVESTDDYKVVCLQTLQSCDGGVHAEVSIYNLKTESWRRIDQLKGRYLRFPGVFANGRIYWSRDLRAPPKPEIVSLDISSEKFVELQPPEYDDGNCLLRMGVFSGRPFVLCDYWERKKVDFWVLDKRGPEESWCKLVSIPHTVINHKTCVLHYRVLCISRNGEIVFGSQDGLLVYNWKKKKHRNIKLAVGITTYRRVAAYVESLVWPDYA